MVAFMIKDTLAVTLKLELHSKTDLNGIHSFYRNWHIIDMKFHTELENEIWFI